MDKEPMGWHFEDYGGSLTAEDAPFGIGLNYGPPTGKPPPHMPRPAPAKVDRPPVRKVVGRPPLAMRTGCPGCGNYIGACPDCPYA